LVTVVSLLVAAATARLSYGRTRAGTAGGMALIGLDAIAVVAVLIAVPALSWMTVVAGVVSLTRMVWTACALGRVVSR
jgi:hypothetical protein